MSKPGVIWPKIRSHAHYPAFLLDIAAMVPAGKSKKVFENWDAYVKVCAKLSVPVSMIQFKKSHFYDILPAA